MGPVQVEEVGRATQGAPSFLRSGSAGHSTSTKGPGQAPPTTPGPLWVGHPRRRRHAPAVTASPKQGPPPRSRSARPWSPGAGGRGERLTVGGRPVTPGRRAGRAAAAAAASGEPERYSSSGHFAVSYLRRDLVEFVKWWHHRLCPLKVPLLPRLGPAPRSREVSGAAGLKGPRGQGPAPGPPPRGPPSKALLTRVHGLQPRSLSALPSPRAQPALSASRSPLALPLPRAQPALPRPGPRRHSSTPVGTPRATTPVATPAMTAQERSAPRASASGSEREAGPTPADAGVWGVGPARHPSGALGETRGSTQLRRKSRKLKSSLSPISKLD